MENIIIISLLTTFVFTLVKIVIMKYVDKEMKPLKFLVKDAIIVFLSACAATFAFYHLNGNISQLLNVITDTKTIPVPGTAEIFTDTPGF
jgi:hypothetical protein